MKIPLPGRRSLEISTREDYPEDWQITLRSWFQRGWDDDSESWIGDFTHQVICLFACTPRKAVTIRLNLAPQYHDP